MRYTSMDEVSALLKACIISRKGGIRMSEINWEYKQSVGEAIPYQALGYRSLSEFLRNISTIRVKNDRFGDRILTVNDAKVAHIGNLVRRQKDQPKFSTMKKRNENIPFRENNRAVVSQNRANSRWENINSRRNDLHATNNNNNNDPAWNRINESGSDTSDDQCAVVSKPIFSGKQLIGDDFFLQLAIRNFRITPWKLREKAAIQCGLCISGQTIKDCRRRLERAECVSNRLVILLGAVDVLCGNSLENMICEMTEILALCEDKFGLSRSAVTLCTIPPLANLSALSNVKQLTVLYPFNNWIRSLGVPSKNLLGSDCQHSNYYPVIDLFKRFTDENLRTQYDYFEEVPRMVSGCSFPHVLWSPIGRAATLEMITLNRDPIGRSTPISDSSCVTPESEVSN